MFRNSYQSGLLSILYSCGASPLELWGMQVKNGFIRRVTDEEVKSLALEIAGTNVATTFIYAPKNPKIVLAINLPFLIMVIKNMKKYFTFEITILDDKRMHRRFRISNFQSTTKVRPFCTTMPIGLACGWNQIQFNLADFTRRAYGSNYIETTRMQIHANCRIRRIYFADRLYTEDELPEDYKLLFPARHESKPRESFAQDKKPGERSQARISVEAAPADEPPAFHADTEKLIDEEVARKTSTPVAKAEPSRTVVAPDGASRVKLEIEANESDYDETMDHEMEFESEIEENEATEEILGDEQKTTTYTRNEEEEQEEDEEEEEEEEKNVEATEDENEEEQAADLQV